MGPTSIKSANLSIGDRITTFFLVTEFLTSFKKQHRREMLFSSGCSYDSIDSLVSFKPRDSVSSLSHGEGHSLLWSPYLIFTGGSEVLLLKCHSLHL